MISAIKNSVSKFNLPYNRNEIISLSLMAAAFVLIHFIFPDTAGRVYTTSLDYLTEMALILIPVFILMGLFEVWVDKEFIEKHLGEKSGIKGMLLCFLFGSLPTGPLYIAFPIAGTLLNKGARIMNITLFLGAWSSTKLPQVLVEFKFLGVEFTLVLQVLTIASVFIIGFLVEKLMYKKTI